MAGTSLNGVFFSLDRVMSEVTDGGTEIELGRRGARLGGSRPE